MIVLKGKRLQIRRRKTEYNIQNGFGGREQVINGTRRVMTMSKDPIGEIESFKYLKTFAQNNGGFNKDVVLILV